MAIIATIRPRLAWFNTGCYQLPAFGTRGNAGRHALYSHGLLNWDASATKQWPFTENKSVQFRAEFFNAANWRDLRSSGHPVRLSRFRQSDEHHPPAGPADPVCAKIPFLMTRRELFQEFGVGLAASGVLTAAPAGPVETLAGTEPLTWEGDLAERLMDGAHQFLERQIADSISGAVEVLESRSFLPRGIREIGRAESPPVART